VARLGHFDDLGRFKPNLAHVVSQPLSSAQHVGGMPGQGANAGDSDQGFEFIQKAGVILFGVLVWAGHRVASNVNRMMNDE
jgi:hypothetical protein